MFRGARKTYSLLGELAGALVARVAEKLNDAALVGSEASNLLDDVADESGALAEVALGAGDAGLDNASGGLLYSVQKKSNVSVHRLQKEWYDSVTLVKEK